MQLLHTLFTMASSASAQTATPLKMKQQLAVLLLAQIVAQIAAQESFGECGQNIDLAQNRITQLIDSGSDPLGTWPWMASVGLLKDRRDWDHLCGAVIISRQFVLTAAHCIVDERLQLRIGDKNLKSSSDDFGANIRDIARTTFHPKYNHRERNAYFDIAVLRVSPQITYSSFIRPICFPPVTEDVDQNAGQLVTVTGWGFSTRNSADGGEVLRSVPIRIYPQRSCNQSHSEGISSAQELQISQHLPQLFSGDLLCAGYDRPLYGPCKGDSGSPLVIYHFEQHRYVLVGLVQGGIGSCGDKDFPAIFTRIDAEEVHNFIAKETGVVPAVGQPNEPSSTPSPIDVPSPGANSTQEALLRAVEATLSVILAIQDFNKSVNLNLDATDDLGNSLVMNFAKFNRYDAVKALLDRGANVHHVNDQGQNALMVAAAMNGTLRIVHLLISHGINIHQPDLDGKTALSYAASVGNLPVLQSLVTRGLSINSRDRDNLTPLFYASFFGKYGTVKHLLEQGADIHVRSQKEKLQPIHAAAKGPDGSTVIALLLAYRADIESKDIYKATPIYHTFVSGHLNSTQELYRLGASLEAVNNAGESVLHKAAQFGFIEHMRWLRRLNRGLFLRRFLNRADDFGETPLITAAFSNQLEAVQELLSYGAEKSVKDNSGNTALDYANTKKYYAIAKILQ